jgi:hypothetical protein
MKLNVSRLESERWLEANLCQPLGLTERPGWSEHRKVLRGGTVPRQFVIQIGAGLPRLDAAGYSHTPSATPSARLPFATRIPSISPHFTYFCRSALCVRTLKSPDPSFYCVYL